MLTYQGDPKVKEMFQARFAEHRAADEVIQGTGFRNGRGCFIGCTMNAYDHESFAHKIGPKWLAYLADEIFEGIPLAEAPQFGTDLLAAIPVGEDVGKVRFEIAIARHKRQLVRLEGNVQPYAEECKKAIQGVISYCEKEILGYSNVQSAAESAVRSAELAARSARSAAWSAESAAESTWSAAVAAKSAWSAAKSAWSAARAAESAAESAAWSAWSAARSAELAAESAARSAELAAESSAQSAAQSSAQSSAQSAAAAESAWSKEYQIERDTLLNALRNV